MQCGFEMVKSRKNSWVVNLHLMCIQSVNGHNIRFWAE